jgi:hypothetical protein
MPDIVSNCYLHLAAFLLAQVPIYCHMTLSYDNRTPKSGQRGSIIESKSAEMNRVLVQKCHYPSSLSQPPVAGILIAFSEKGGVRYGLIAQNR